MKKVLTIHEAFRRGDLETLKSALGDPTGFPNTRETPMAIGTILEYAIYHSPVPLIQTLLELGADPNFDDGCGFPSIIAALSSERSDKLEIIDLLLRFGADIQQHGVNDWTPLHYAAAGNDAKAMAFLLSRKADPQARTRIDDYATPLEEAEILGCTEAVATLKKLLGGCPTIGPKRKSRSL